MQNDMSGAVGGLIILVLLFVIVGVPLMQILHRTGFSRAWVLLWLVPVVGLVFLWIYAFIRWPIEGDDGAGEGKATGSR
jgi:hypothetical protein